MNLWDQELRNFKPGIYLHFKGNLYEADHLMRDANQDSRVGVHYIGLTTNGAREGPRHLIRTWEDWNAKLHEDGTVCDKNEDNKCSENQELLTPRFRYLGPYYETKMLDQELIG